VEEEEDYDGLVVMASGDEARRCASPPLQSGEQHVEKQSMHSSFKGPPSPGTNRPMSEGQNQSGNSCAVGGSNVGVTRGGEENLDVSIHRGLEELMDQQASGGASDHGGECQLLDQSAARRDPNGRASSSRLRPSHRLSASSDEDYERVDISTESSAEELRRKLRESERARRELEDALRLSEIQNAELSEREELRRRAHDDRATDERRMRDMEDLLRLKDMKLDEKRREIIRLRTYLLVYERDFISLNDRARFAEELNSRIDTGLIRNRERQYANNLGLASSCSREARMEDRERSPRHTDREACNDEALSRIARSYTGSRARSPSPGTEQYEYVPPRPGYGRLEIDSSSELSGEDTSDSSHIRRVAEPDEDETPVLLGSDSSLSENGNVITSCSDDHDQLMDEMERRQL